ncbi:MAG: hypothetical protein Q9170_002147 [Blastenia crenularia]
MTIHDCQRSQSVFSKENGSGVVSLSDAPLQKKKPPRSRFNTEDPVYRKAERADNGDLAFTRYYICCVRYSHTRRRHEFRLKLQPYSETDSSGRVTNYVGGGDEGWYPEQALAKFRS